MPEAGSSSSKSLLVQDSTQHKTWITFPTLRKMANYTYLLVLVLVVTIITLLIKNTTLSRELQDGILAHGTVKKALLVDLQNESSRYRATRREVELSRNKLRDLDRKLKSAQDELLKSASFLQEANDDNVKLKSELEDKTKIVEKINEENKDLKSHFEEKKMHLLEAEEKLRSAEEELPKLRETVRKIQEELQAAKAESQYNLETLKKFQERYTKLAENKGLSAIKQVFKKTQGSKLRQDARKTYRGGTGVAQVAEHHDHMRKINSETHVEDEGEQHDDMRKMNRETHVEHEGKQHDDMRKINSETHVEDEGEQHDDMRNMNRETHVEDEGEQHDNEDEQKQQQDASTPFIRNETVVTGRLNTTKTVLSPSQPEKQPQEREDVREKEDTAVEEKSKDDPQTMRWTDKRIKTEDEQYEYEEEKLENDKVGKNK